MRGACEGVRVSVAVGVEGSEEGEEGRVYGAECFVHL